MKKHNYYFVVENDYPKNPILCLRHECCVRTDIPEDIRNFIKNLKTYSIEEFEEQETFYEWCKRDIKAEEDIKNEKRS